MRNNTKEYDREYYYKNKDKLNSKSKINYINNKDRVIKYNVNKYRNDENKRIKENVRGWTRYHFNKIFCVNCGINKDLEFHHIDYNKTENSFIVLCRNCHRKILINKFQETNKG